MYIIIEHFLRKPHQIEYLLTWGVTWVYTHNYRTPLEKTTSNRTFAYLCLHNIDFLIFFLQSQSESLLQLCLCLHKKNTLSHHVFTNVLQATSHNLWKMRYHIIIQYTPTHVYTEQQLYIHQTAHKPQQGCWKTMRGRRGHSRGRETILGWGPWKGRKRGRDREREGEGEEVEER